MKVMWEDPRPFRSFSRNTRAGAVAQLVECLPCISSAVDSINCARCHRPIAPVLETWRQKRRKFKVIYYHIELEVTLSEGR